MEEHPVLRSLTPDEEIRIQAAAGDSIVVVTNKRLAIGSHERVALDVPIDNLRRIQFDIERDRPATLVFVPEHPADEPQVLVVSPDDYAGVAEALGGPRKAARRGVGPSRRVRGGAAAVPAVGQPDLDERRQTDAMEWCAARGSGRSAP